MFCLGPNHFICISGSFGPRILFPALALSGPVHIGSNCISVGDFLMDLVWSSLLLTSSPREYILRFHYEAQIVFLFVFGL